MEKNEGSSEEWQTMPISSLQNADADVVMVENELYLIVDKEYINNKMRYKIPCKCL